MRKVFLDCGFYYGATLKRYLDKKIINSTWVVYAFEPNLKIEPDLSIYKNSITLIRRAVWTKDGKARFMNQEREDAGRLLRIRNTGVGMSVMVPTIDFSTFVKELDADEIICSMDIEGAEFAVLAKMLRDNTIDRIKLLEVEFHHRLMNDYVPDDARNLIQKIKERGVKVKLKVPLI